MVSETFTVHCKLSLAQSSNQILHRRRSLTHHTLVRPTADVRREVDIRQPQQWIIELHRLWIEHICTVSSYVPCANEIGKSSLVDERTSTHIHYIHSTTAHHQSAPVQKMLVITGEAHVDRKKIRVREDVLIFRSTLNSRSVL
jgi:hypothetical protein